MTKIVLKTKNAVVICKPAGIPSQPDPSGDADAMTLTAGLLKDISEREELYLVHRLDRVVGGLMVFARNKKSAAELSSLVSGDGIGKEYFAVVEGAPTDATLTDMLVKDARLNMARVARNGERGAKEARLEYKTLAVLDTENGTRSLLRVKLDTGRFHQIRAQLSSHGNPIVGDNKYGSRDRASHMPALFSRMDLRWQLS